jgi:hypothetical protein
MISCGHKMRWTEEIRMRSAILMILFLSGTAWGQISYDIAIHDVPNSAAGTVIGIPRQQAVCLTEAGQLVVMWDGRYFYKTTDRGQSWADSFDNGNLGRAGYVHQHLVVWSDTIWNFSPDGSQSDGFVQVIRGSDLGQVGIYYQPSSANQPIYSGQRDGTSDGMVMIQRGSGVSVQYCHSTDRGRSWGDWQLLYSYPTNCRIGLISVGDSCMALIYSGTVDVWHWHPSSMSWTLEGDGHFITSGYTQRAYTGTVWNDTIWVAINDGNFSTTYCAKRQVGSGPITIDTLWHGNPAYRGGPEYIGYNALEVVESLDRPVIFYVHPDDGSSGPDASKLYIRVWDNGAWSPEQLVSAGAGTANLTSPFIVPTSHGNYAYCLFDDYAGGHLAVVEIDVGGIAPPRDVRWIEQEKTAR